MNLNFKYISVLMVGLLGIVLIVILSNFDPVYYIVGSQRDETSGSFTFWTKSSLDAIEAPQERNFIAEQVQIRISTSIEVPYLVIKNDGKVIVSTPPWYKLY